jgi:hypothetical protein
VIRVENPTVVLEKPSKSPTPFLLGMKERVGDKPQDLQISAGSLDMTQWPPPTHPDVDA